ncbi:serine protease 23-like [Saccostrea echinata]|uniref:serine protease 23-like n=1 Tax=Saccostrea echinata TaxID=191078 RepID=UPI002A7EBB8A|nr:serine protease 23-like [Saccostrea echinata]
MEEVTLLLYFCVLHTIYVCTHAGENQPRVHNDSFLLNDTMRPLDLGTEHLLLILPSQQVYTVKILPSVASRKHENERVFFRKSYLKNTQASQDNILKTYKREPKKSEFVYGSDDRSLVENYKLGQYPYFNVVKLSSGCTGTLLTPSYILTAAHCVHDGTKFHERMELLKILIPHKMGYRLYYAKEIIVPFDWQKAEGVSDARRVVFDYAVIRLDISVFGRHDFSPLGTVKFSIYSEKLCFFAFPNNENLMWKSECNGWNSFPLFNQNVLLNKCDSARGNSGATILAQDNRHGNTYKIIGVLSSVLPEKHYTSFSLLTKDKISDICTMIHPEGKTYKICPQNESLLHTSRLYKG